MLAGAYSNRFRLLQEQQVRKLKILNAAAGDAALENGGTHHQSNKNGKSRQLSLETNKRRKVQEMRRKMVALKEEKRRQDILLQRRQLQQEATERFQRAPLQNKNKTRTNLEEILCIIRGGTDLFNAVTRTKQGRSSSAHVLSKDRDKRNNSPLHGVNKLLSNRPSSQPGRAVANDHLHDQSLRNLTNSRNLFEQQLRRKLQHQDQTKESEPVSVTRVDEGDTDSENDLYSVDSVEDRRQDEVLIEQDQQMRSTEGNRNKQQQTEISNCAQNSGFKIEPKQINIPSYATARVNTNRQEQYPIKQANDIQQQQQQQQQQIPSEHQRNLSVVTLASGDNKNTSGTLQANETSSFRKTAWIQPSSIVNNELSSFYQPMPAWVDSTKTGTHLETCQTNSKEVNEDQSCSQQQANKILPKDKPPIKQTIFQPKHNFYERQLSSTFHPVTSGLSQQRILWLNEREQQSKNFSNSQRTEQCPDQTRIQANSDTATDSEPVSYVQSKNISEKKEPKITERQENKLKGLQTTGPIEISQISVRNGDHLAKSSGKSENNNNRILPEDNSDDQPIKTKQNQHNSQPQTKIKKNNVWQESDRKTLPKKLPFANRKPVRSILKVTAVENNSMIINGTQRRDIKDSLEIARQQHINSGSRETTATNTKSAKKHVHFASEDQYYEMTDDPPAMHTDLICNEVTSNAAEETSSENNNNSNNYHQTQKSNGNIQQKANGKIKESDSKDTFDNKSGKKPQVTCIQPNERPQAKAHIIKQTPQTIEEKPQITDPTPSNATLTDEKGNNKKPFSKNNHIQYITMGTLKRLVASNNQKSVTNAKNSFLQKELETPKESMPFTVKSGFSVDKTPTDEEINWLWDKVQLCLQQKSTPKSVAQPQTTGRTKATLSHTYLDGEILGKNNAMSVGKTSPSFWYPPTYNGGFAIDGKLVPNVTKKMTLLHQRPSLTASRMPVTNTLEKVPSAPSETGTPLKSESRLPATDLNVTSSLAVFLKAEEMSQMASVTESQALVAMKETEVGAPLPSGASLKSKGSPSILSLEEKRLMESLERINNKLKGCTSDYNHIGLNRNSRYPFLADQLQDIKVPPIRYQVSQPSPPNQTPLKGWMKGAEL